MEMNEGDIVVLENLNFYPGELQNEADFARQLASLCDVYIDDAFEAAHRALASNVGITRWAPISAADWLRILFEKQNAARMSGCPKTS